MESSDVASTHRLSNTQRSLAKDVEYVRLLAWEALESRPNQPVNEAIRKRFFRSWVAAVEEERPPMLDE